MDLDKLIFDKETEYLIKQEEKDFLAIKKHFHITSAFDEIDASPTYQDDFKNVNHLLSKKMINPNDTVAQFLMDLYQEKMVLQANTKAIDHIFIQGLRRLIMEKTSIGLLKLDDELIGYAKVTTIMNPIFYVDTIESLNEIEGDVLTLTEKEYFHNFIYEDQIDFRNYFDIVNVDPKLMPALEKGNIAELYRNINRNFTNTEIYKA